MKQEKEDMTDVEDIQRPMTWHDIWEQGASFTTPVDSMRKEHPSAAWELEVKKSFHQEGSSPLVGLMIAWVQSSFPFVLPDCLEFFGQNAVTF